MNDDKIISDLEKEITAELKPLRASVGTRWNSKQPTDVEFNKHYYPDEETPEAVALYHASMGVLGIGAIVNLITNTTSDGEGEDETVIWSLFVTNQFKEAKRLLEQKELDDFRLYQREPWEGALDFSKARSPAAASCSELERFSSIEYIDFTPNPKPWAVVPDDMEFLDFGEGSSLPLTVTATEVLSHLNPMSFFDFVEDLEYPNYTPLKRLKEISEQTKPEVRLEKPSGDQLNIFIEHPTSFLFKSTVIQTLRFLLKDLEEQESDSERSIE